MSGIGPLPGKGLTLVLPTGQIIGVQMGDITGEFGERSFEIGRIVNGAFIVDATVKFEDDGSWSNDTNLAGGMGNLQFGNHKPGDIFEKGLMPQIAKHMADLYTVDLNAPPVTNQEPFNAQRWNSMLWQFSVLVWDPAINGPVLKQKGS